MPDPSPVRLHNVVATFFMGGPIDLRQLVRRMPHIEFNSRKFAAASFRMLMPHGRATALVFSSGNMVVTGSATEDAALLAARRFSALIQAQLPDRFMHRFAVQNLVGAADLRAAVDLAGMVRDHESTCNYEPELFPGLVMRRYDVVFLVFRSGKVVLTGARQMSAMRAAYASACEEVFRHYRREGEDTNSSHYHAQLTSTAHTSAEAQECAMQLGAL